MAMEAVYSLWESMGIVDGYTEGLRYMIECEKESNSRQDVGDLGVRVQTGGMTSDPTAKKAIRNVLTREALINCDFSGDVMDGVDRADEYMRDAYLLRDMRKGHTYSNSRGTGERLHLFAGCGGSAWNLTGKAGKDCKKRRDRKTSGFYYL